MIVDVIENPGNKTLKSLTELKWALEDCPADYFVHVPEDFEVIPHNLLIFIYDKLRLHSFNVIYRLTWPNWRRR